MNIRSFSLRGREIWCAEAGDPASPAPPLVCVPGGPGLSHDYLVDLEQLADREPRRRVVFYDAMGSGRSQKGPPEDWTLATYVEEASAVCTVLGLERFHLFAHSAASFVAFTLAIDHAPGLASIILCSGPASFPAHTRYLRTALATLGLSPGEIATFEEGERNTAKRDNAYRRIYQAYIDRYLCSLRPLPRPLVLSARAINGAALHQMKGGLVFYHSALATWDVTDRLAEIEVPVLYTCGRDDLIPVEACEQWVARMPRAELAIFERSTHMAHLEETSAYLARVSDFLARVDADLSRA